MATPDDALVPDAIPEPSLAPAEPAPSGPTMSTYRALVGFLATILSVGGTGLTLPRMLVSAAHGSPNGDVAIVVRDAKVGNAVGNASIEILTTENALITTVTSDAGGQAQHSLKEGHYRVRVRHPQYAMHTQPVVVMKGQRTVVPVRLRDDVPAAAPVVIDRPAPPRAAPPRAAPPPPHDPAPFLPREQTSPQAS